MAIQHFTDLDSALTGFSTYLFVMRGAREITVNNQLGAIKRASAEIGVDPSEEQIHRYIADLAQHTASYSHISNTCVAIEHYTDFLGRPIKLGRPRKPFTLVKGALSVEEVGALIAATTNARDRAMLVTLAYTGIRNTELCNLLVSDIDLERRTICIRGTKIVRDRIIPLAEPCADVLRVFLAKHTGRYDALLFVTKRKGDWIEPQVVRKIIRACAERAGIRKRVYPHLLRHSLATNLMHSGTGILAIKQQMGHAHLGTTMRYLHGDPERLKQEFLVHVPDYLSSKTGND